MNKSLIEWCDFTWNPVTGCQHGCLYCYAAKQANRFSGNVLINKTSEQLRKEWDERGSRWVLEKPFKNEIGKVTPFPVKFEPMFREYCRHRQAILPKHRFGSIACLCRHRKRNRRLYLW